MGIFKAYDIRGLVPSELEPGMARRIGRANFVRNGRERLFGVFTHIR